MASRFFGTVDVALLLKCSTEYVRQLEKAGKLTAERTPSGRRIFRADEVKRLATERERQKDKRVAK